MKTKFKSTIRAACHSFGGAVCAGAFLLLTASTQAQNLFEADEDSGNIYEFTPGGAQSTFASGLNEPAGLAFNSAGDLFVACVGGGVDKGYITEITPGGVQSTFASGLDEPWGLAFNSAGDLFVACEGGSGLGGGGVGLKTGNIYEFTPGGVKSTFASALSYPAGLAFNGAGDLFVGNLTNVIEDKGYITEITPGGVQSTFASGLVYPEGLAFNSFGDLFVANYSDNGNITEFTPAGSQITFASGLDYPRLLACNSAGDLFVANAGDNDIIEITPVGAQSIFVSGLDDPDGLAFQPVPEPSALGLLAVGVTALLVRRRR